MARTKKEVTDTTSTIEEKNTIVETEKPVNTEGKPVDNANEPEKDKAKEKPIKDEDKIIIKCAAYAGKSIILPTRTIELDEKGCCEVTGIEARRLLSIPGYERTK